MTDEIFYTAYDDMPPAVVRLRRGRRPRRSTAGLGVLCLLAAGATALGAGPARGPGSLRMPAFATRVVLPLRVADALAVPRRVTDGPLLGPGFIAGSPSGFAGSRPMPARFVFADAPKLTAAAEAPAPTVSRDAMASASETATPGPQVVAASDPTGDAETVIPSVPPSASPLLAADVPLPAPRPTDIAPTVTHAPPFRAARKPTVLASYTPSAKPMVSPDNRSFLERFFGMGQQDGKPVTPALGYAAPEDGWFSGLRGAASGNPARTYGDGTAVYEIASHTVFMPDGSRLEAHSGLGSRLDDPRFVHERMRGPTPPATYALKARESLFHGVQALRLTPIGSSVFGRDGLLAHTYMLGPKGDSNGCVSFRDYRTFLQAFQRGDVRRLVVVARLT